MKREITETVYEYIVNTSEGAVKIQLSRSDLMVLLNNIRNDIGWKEIDDEINPSNWKW